MAVELELVSPKVLDWRDRDWCARRSRRGERLELGGWMLQRKGKRGRCYSRYARLATLRFVARLSLKSTHRQRCRVRVVFRRLVIDNMDLR